MRRRRGVANDKANDFGISTPEASSEVLAQFAAVASRIVFPLRGQGFW